jgi:hypothetical protein
VSLRLVVLALAVASSAARPQPQPRIPLVLLASAGDYPGETYTAGPSTPAEFVFFVGEPLAIDVSVANWGTGTASIHVPDPRETVVAAQVWREGAVQVEARPPAAMWHDTLGESRRVQPSATMSMDAGDAVRWRLMVDTTTLTPGFYEALTQTTVTAVTSEGATPVRLERAGFTFEMRARSDALREELLRREAEWLTATGDPASARAATLALERIYPDSVVVHLIRSRIAEAEGNERLARQELDRAAAFMRADRDVLFRRYARPGQIEDLVDALRP